MDLPVTRYELEEAHADALRLDRAYDLPTHKRSNEQIRIEENRYGVSIAIAGSNDIWDWWQNYTAFRWLDLDQWWSFHRTIPGTRWKATAGYVSASETLLELIEPELRSKDKPIFFSGHSAGGPKAAITALRLWAKGYQVAKVRTFAAPRYSVQEILASPIRESTQYIAEGDVIPDYPKPIGVRTWQHQGRVVEIGEPVNDFFGLVRDGIRAHLIENYILAISDRLNELKENLP